MATGPSRFFRSPPGGYFTGVKRLPIPNRQTVQTDESDLEILLCDDGSYTLRNLELDETYHSGCGAVSESLWVYLLKSGVAERLAASKQDDAPQPITVVEYGFGTGTSFLLTAAFASLCEAPLSFLGLENRILPRLILSRFELSKLVTKASSPNASPQQTEFNDLRAALSPLLEIAGGKSPSDFAACLYQCEQELLRQWETVCSPETHFQVELNPFVKLHLVVADATDFDSERLAATTGNPHCDSIYFDPFAPEVSPEFWQPSQYRRLFDLVQEDGSLASYCVKGVVQREMRGAGFAVAKVPGPPGGKREVLLAKRAKEA